MERKIKKLEAEAAQCRELETANGLLACRLEAAENSRNQREHKLRKKLAERRYAQQRFELELESAEIPASVFVKAAPTMPLGTHLAKELQNLLRTEELTGNFGRGVDRQQIAAGRNCDKCCGWCDCATSAGQKYRTRHLTSVVGWPSLSEEGSLFWVASELEVSDAGHHNSSSSKSPGVLPSPMVTATATQSLVKKLALAAEDLVQVAAEAEAHVKNQEACLELNLQHFHKKFCQIHAQQEALYTSLAIELFVKREAVKKQATLKGELNSISPALRLPENWNADEDCHTVIACASRLLREADEMKEASPEALDPWATLIRQRRHASKGARAHINSLRSALAAALVAVDQKARPGTRIVSLERRLQLGLEAVQDGVKKAMSTLETVAECATCIEASSNTEAGVSLHQPMDVNLGNISKCLLTLFCGSSSKANTELAKHKEDHPEQSSSEGDLSSCESFGVDAEDTDIDNTHPAPARRKRTSAQRVSGWALSRQVKALHQHSMALHRRSETLVRFASLAAPKKLLLEALGRRAAHSREVQQMGKNDFDVATFGLALAKEAKMLDANILQRAKNTTLETQTSDALAIITSESKEVADRLLLHAKNIELQRQSLERQPFEAPAVITNESTGVTDPILREAKNSFLQRHSEMLEASPALVETPAARAPSPASSPLGEQTPTSLANTLRADERKSTPEQIHELLKLVVESRVQCAISNVVDQRCTEFISVEDREAHREDASREELANREEIVQPPKMEEKECELFISRSDTQKFGMSLIEDDNGHASVTAIRAGGRVDEWNAQNLATNIIVGDTLISVNGKTSYRELMNELKSSTEVAIRTLKLISMGEEEKRLSTVNLDASSSNATAALAQPAVGHITKSDLDGTTIAVDASPSQRQVAKVVIARIYRAAARAERRQVRKVAAKKKAVIEKKTPKRVQCIKRSWRAEDPLQMCVVKGEFVSLWTASVTDDGWIYAEKIVTGGAVKAGWLPTHVLKPLLENRRWMRTVRSWKAADQSQCSVAGGILVLVMTDSRTKEGWAYVEASDSAGSQMGWLPDSCLQWNVQ